jgi:hypothetical protein
MCLAVHNLQDAHAVRKKLQKLRQRKYFDSGEYYLQDSRQADAGGGDAAARHLVLCALSAESSSSSTHNACISNHQTA